MPIVMRLDRVMADRKISSLELAEKIGISPVNVSRIKTGRLKGIRFSTLTAMCEALHCKPGDIIDWMDDDEYEAAFGKLPERSSLGAPSKARCAIDPDASTEPLRRAPEGFFVAAPRRRAACRKCERRAQRAG